MFAENVLKTRALSGVRHVNTVFIQTVMTSAFLTVRNVPLMFLTKNWYDINKYSSFVSIILICISIDMNLQLNVVQNHHWREGNLPANSKCHYCKKTCWSTECLAGMRCEWCGATVRKICERVNPLNTNCLFDGV